GCHVNVHATITHAMLQRPGYIQEFIGFWNARPEVVRIWVSTFTPQIGEQSAEILTPADRKSVTQQLLKAKNDNPKLLINDGIANAILHPPSHPSECMFAKMSTNYTADLQTRVEPCIFGKSPNYSQYDCAISSGLH